MPKRRMKHPFSMKEAKNVQKVTGTIMYYASAIDSTILVALSTIVADQTAPMKQTM